MKSSSILLAVVIVVLGSAAHAGFVKVYTFPTGNSNFDASNYLDSRTDQLADFDGDGFPEIFPENGSSLTIVKLTGPTFTPTVLWSYTLSGTPVSVQMWAANVTPHAGREVIIIANYTPPGPGQPHLLQVLVVSSTGVLIEDLGWVNNLGYLKGTGDFNGDGYEDLICLPASNAPVELWSYSETVGATPSTSMLGQLEQNSPNPFNPSTTIAFELPSAGESTLEVFDQRGSLVWKRDLGFLEAGRHVEIWDGTDAAGQRVSSGIYHYALSVDQWRASRKMVLVK
ncbi:MAG: hypothetical protein IPK64_02380 [bacterium]|nr:hypothetical protein [bacterium]